MSKRGRLDPPLRRVLAVDAGSRTLRLLLLESRFGRLQLVDQDAMDLQEEGLVSPQEVRAHLRKTLDEWGRPTVALVLPQQVAVSQSIELPPGPESDSRKLIEAETVKLGGVSESTIIYDFVRVPSPDPERHRYWVTFCQEVEIQGRITQLGLENEDFREITTAANGLLTAWLVSHPQSTNAILIHTGAQSTIVVILVNGTGVFATSFPMGGEALTRAMARSQKISVDVAEIRKREENLLESASPSPGVAVAVNEWAAELKRQLNEWSEHQRGIGRDLSAFGLFASGGMFEQRGLLDYLKNHAALKLQRWPIHSSSDVLRPKSGFEIAFGAAAQALGLGPQPVSLLPADRRAAWKARLGGQRLEFASSIILAIVFLALGFGIWQKLSLIQQKRSLLAKVEAGLMDAQANDRLSADVLSGFDMLRPLFERQQNTTDMLHTLDRLQEARANRPFWFVLVADQQSYFSYSPPPSRTNRLGVATETPVPRPGALPEISPAKPGCIAELCVPDDPDGARRTLSSVVTELKKDPIFARVDLLSEDLRRNLADSKVIVPDKHFALALDFATTEFQRPVQPRKSRSTTSTRGPGRLPGMEEP